MASVSSVAWSSSKADVGENVTVTAYLSNIKKETSVQFRIVEYSGSGRALKIIAEIECTVGRDDKEAHIGWVVTAVEDSYGSGIPEFRAQASVNGKSWIGTPETLTLGRIKELKWIRPVGGTPKTPEQSKFQIYFRDCKTLQLEAKIERLRGFLVDFHVYGSERTSKGKLNYKKIDKILSVPIKKGSARASWVPDTLKHPEYRGRDFYFEICVRHAESPFVYNPVPHRSPYARHYPRLVWFALYYENSTTVPDKAFQKAATCWIQSVYRLKAWKDSDAHTFTWAFTKHEDFIRSWEKIVDFCNELDAIIMEGHVFSHAFCDGFRLPDTDFKTADIKSLAKLPWFTNGKLVLHGCNTGVQVGGTCAANAFADRQEVECVGQAGFSYFSETDHSFSYFMKGPEVYLWSYERRDNTKDRRAWGPKMSGIFYKPD